MTKDVEHRWAVDSIESGTARVEEDGERIISVPEYLLPAGVTEGQLLRVTRAPAPAKGTAVITIAVDTEGTREAVSKSKATMASALEASKKRDPGGNVTL
jgi:hypothetical protein